MIKHRDIDYKYLNIIITNDGGEDGNRTMIANIDETKKAPLLDDVADWELSIVRFKVPLSVVPLFKFQTDAPDSNTGIYTVELQYTDDTRTIESPPMHLEWDYTVFPFQYDQKEVWYYSDFVRLTNRAIERAFEDYLIPLVEAAGGPTLTEYTEAPIISYDPSTRLFNVTCKIKNVGGVNPSLHNIWNLDEHPIAPFGDMSLSLIFNSHLFYYFNGFMSTTTRRNDGSYTFNILIPGRKALEQFRDKDFYDIPDPLKPEAYQVTPADYPCLSLWQRLSRIVFTTTMPISQESISSNLKTLIGQPINQSILTDYEVFPTDQANREYLYFYNQGTPRYVSFEGFGPLRDVKIGIYAEDNQLNVRPLILPPNSEIYLKIQFRRRGLRSKTLKESDEQDNLNSSYR